METYRYPHLGAVAYVALLIDIKNASSLRERIVKASVMPGEEGDVERENVNFAFINARLITSRTHLRTAIHQSILAESQKDLRTKTVHSEILWTLNPTNNITEAFRRYGVTDSTTTLIVVRVATSDLADAEEKIKSVVYGNLVAFDGIANITDWPLIIKYHKLSSDPAITNTARDVPLQRASVDTIVTSSVAMKSVLL